MQVHWCHVSPESSRVHHCVSNYQKSAKIVILNQLHLPVLDTKTSPPWYIMLVCNEGRMSSSMGSVVDLSASLRCLKHLFVKIRSKDTQLTEFKRHANRIMALIVEEGLSYINSRRECVIETPTGCNYKGYTFDPENIVLISIIRAADSMLDVAMGLLPEASVGKILIQRNEETAEPVLYYSKLPPLQGKTVIVLDPMLATGGSAKTAINVLLSLGALEENMAFFCIVSCPEGVKNMTTSFPKLTIVTGEMDERLNEKKYIVPGLGDYGDRYYGT